MAIRDDFTAGEVLLAADLNDTFGSKVPFEYSDTEPTTDIGGFIWFDTNDSPPSPYYYDADEDEFIPFPSGVSGGAAISSPAPSGNYTDGGVEYDFWTFNSSSSIDVSTAGFADVLVVGGGGGGSYGGGRGAGGGGAGGYLNINDYYLPAGTLTVTIGAGGTAGNLTTQDAKPGNGSLLGILPAPGGGGGADNLGLAGHGGSGGGRSRGSARVGLGVPGFGNDGGTSVESSPGFGGGGGGGANSAGGAGTSSAGGSGGAGISSDITGTSVARGGGGGGSTSSGTGGSATAGGGAGGGNNTAGTAGSANTGGGGGAGEDANGGNGGSGVVIVMVRTA